MTATKLISDFHIIRIRYDCLLDSKVDTGTVCEDSLYSSHRIGNVNWDHGSTNNTSKMIFQCSYVTYKSIQDIVFGNGSL